MCRTLLSISFWLLVCSPAVSEQIPPDTSIVLGEDLHVQRIEDGIFVAVHSFPYAANAMLAKLSNEDFLLVDTPWENGATKTLVEWARNDLGCKNLTVINTHFHRDNLGGNGYLLGEGIPVYGSDLTSKLLKEHLENPVTMDWLDKPEYRRYLEVFQATELMPPDHIFPINEGLSLNIGDEVVEVYYPGPAHTYDNIVVYLKDRKILFGGCMIRSLASTRLGYLGDASVKDWPNSARNVKKRYGEAQLVIPGHGSWGDMNLVDHTIELATGYKQE